MEKDDNENAALVHAHRQQAEYFSALSHELRTPLNGLMGYARLLLDGNYGPLSDPQSHAVTQMEGASKHLLEIIESLLEFSKVSHDRRVPVAKATQPGKILQRLANRLEPLTLAKSIRIFVDAEDFTVVSDELILEQIITNLLGNAIKFTPQGGSITLRARHDALNGSFEMGVADSGPGIPPDARQRIFEPFVQLASNNVRIHGGTGLGLALCRWYSNLLQGVIGYEENRPHGSYFFTLMPDSFLIREQVAYEEFLSCIRQAETFARRVPDQFSVLQVTGTQDSAAVLAELRQAAKQSDLICRRDDRYLLGLYGAEPLAARMAGERLKNQFLYQHRLSINVQLLRWSDLAPSR